MGRYPAVARPCSKAEVASIIAAAAVESVKAVAALLLSERAAIN